MAMGAQPQKLTPPDAYPDLPFKEIRCKHVPESSKEVTPIIVLELYRPDKYNAFTEAVMRPELVQAFTLFDIDDRVKCIVVTGYGKMFCAGADLGASFVGGRAKLDGREKAQNHRDGGGTVAMAIHRCRKPVIGALNGSAVGIGITMTLPMTIRIAWKDAKVGFVFARRGIVLDAASTFFLPRLIGMSKALHLTTTAGVYPASHRLMESLFTELLDSPSEVLPRALELANEIVSSTSTISTALIRDMMYRDAGSAEGQHLLDSRILYELYGSPDNEEGVSAFLEKRQAKYQGTLQSDTPSFYPWWNSIDTSIRPVAGGSNAGLKAKL